MKLNSSTALVTGGAVRIGRAICEALAARGCNVVVHYSKSETEALALAESLGREGVNVHTVKADLSSQAECTRAVNEAWERTGGFNILVNNAGIFHKDDLMSVTTEKVTEELRVNFLAPIMLTRAFALHLKADQKSARAGIIGSVVNLLDTRISRHEPDCVPYLLSKKMLAEFTKSAALELAPSITINGVAPGAVLPPPGDGPDRVRDLAGNNPLGRRCTPQDVASAIVFLLEADAITGQVVFVDGGQHLGASHG